MRVRPNYFLERELWYRGVSAVAGVDEAGVGALAGPVVAAAVILVLDAIIDGLADSKLLTPKRREALFTVISRRAVAIAVGQVGVEEVDRLNIYWAAMEARRRGRVGGRPRALAEADLKKARALLRSGTTPKSRLPRNWRSAAKRMAVRGHSLLDESITRHCAAPLRLIFPLLTLDIVMPSLKIHAAADALVQHVIALLLIAGVAWLIIRVLLVAEDMFVERLRLDVPDNLRARGVQTQFEVFRRVASGRYL